MPVNSSCLSKFRFIWFSRAGFLGLLFPRPRPGGVAGDNPVSPKPKQDALRTQTVQERARRFGSPRTW